MQFDAAAAEAVLDAIKPAIAVMKAAADADQKSANRALDGWQGAYANQFSGSEAWIQGEASRIHGGLQGLQGQIAGAIAAARHLQAQHNLANKRWAEAQHHQPVS